MQASEILQLSAEIMEAGWQRDSERLMQVAIRLQLLGEYLLLEQPDLTDRQVDTLFAEAIGLVTVQRKIAVGEVH